MVEKAAIAIEARDTLFAVSFAVGISGAMVTSGRDQHQYRAGAGSGKALEAAKVKGRVGDGRFSPI
jgi:hypothetical protein